MYAEAHQKNLRILHTSDWHLGSKLSSLGTLAQKRTSELLKIIAELPAFVQEQKIDVFLLTGDLFDENAPSLSEKQYVFSILEQMHIPVFLCMGNHDPLTLQSLENISLPKNVHIFGAPGLQTNDLSAFPCSYYLENLSLFLSGSSFHKKTLTESHIPFLYKEKEKLQIPKNARTVLCLHGELLQSSNQTSRYHPIYVDALKNENFDLVALGHIHKKQHFFSDHTLITYSGVLHGRGFDEQGALGFSVIELAPKDLQTPIFEDFHPSSFFIEEKSMYSENHKTKISYFVSPFAQFLEKTFLLDEKTTWLSLEKQLEELNPLHFYKFVFSGKVNQELFYMLQHLSAFLKGKFQYFKIKNTCERYETRAFDELSYIEKLFYQCLEKEKKTDEEKEKIFHLFTTALESKEKDFLLQQYLLQKQETEDSFAWIDEWSER